MALSIKYQVRVVVLLAVLLASAPAARAATVQLPKTGQNLCYDAAGVVIDCAGTGQDGEIQSGGPWPDPRFTDNLDGTVTDHLTGLIWLKDAGCATIQPGGNGVSWNAALINVGTLMNGQCGLTDNSAEGDWRMPNAAELESLIDLSRATIFDQTGNAIPTTNALPAGNPFTNVQFGYWTSTTLPVAPGSAEWIPMNNGALLGRDKTNQLASLWPVRGASTTLPKTGEVACYDAAGVALQSCAGTGQDGDKQSGVAWPTPRFVDTGTTGTVADRLTGLVWLKDANCFGPVASQADALASVKALASGSCGLLDGSVAGNWRLPNRKELRSLVNYSQDDGSIWLDSQGFVNATNGYHWSSDSYAPGGVDPVWSPIFGPNADPALGDKWLVRTIGGTGLSSWTSVIPVNAMSVLAVRDRLTPTVTWADPAAIGVGGALTAAQLNATASVPGSFSYTPAAGTTLSPGTGQTLSVTFTPDDQDDYAPVTKTATINVLPTAAGVLLGDVNGDGQVNIADAQLALLLAVGAGTPSSAELARGDVGPMVGGFPAADGKIDLADALLILEKVVGLATW